MDPAALGVLFQPLAQARPLAQKRLVRDLDGVLVGSDETAVDEHRERGGGRGVALGVELVQRDAAPHEGRPLVPGVGESQEDPLGGVALWLRQSRVGGLGETAHRSAHTAGALVRGPAHHPAVALAPLLEQGGRQQRKTSGLVPHIGDEGVGQRRLDPQPDPPGRLDDRPAQLVASHRANQHLVRSHQPCEPVVRRAAPVEVGAHGDHHLHVSVAVLCQRHDRVEEVCPLLLVAAEREHLLELIDDEQRALAALRKHPLKRGQRMRARAHQPPVPAIGAGEHAARERRQQACSDRRGLPAPRRSDHREERRAHEPRDELGHQPLPTEEVLRVSGVEGGKPQERADRGQWRAILALIQPPALVDRPEGE